MKYLKATTTTPLEAMTQIKMRIVVNGEDSENIWIRKDEETGKAYLLNNSLNFFPFPTWGAEFDYSPTLDVAKVRGEGPDDTILSLHPESYEHMKQFIGDDDEFLFDEYTVNQEKRRAEKSSEEE